MASSELTSCQDFVILCGLNFTFLVMLSGCSLPERFWQMSYSMLLQNQPKVTRVKICTSKKWFCRPPCYYRPPHPSNWDIPRVNRVKRKWWYSKCLHLCQVLFNHTSQWILWEKRRQTGTSTDELLQMNMFMFFLSPLLTRVEGTTESFKIMLRYFHFSAIKGDVQT